MRPFIAHYFLNQMLFYLKVRMRTSISQQLKGLQALNDDDVLKKNNEFSLQKEKPLKEINYLNFFLKYV